MGLRINASDLIEALSDHSGMAEWFLNPRTGAVRMNVDRMVDDGLAIEPMPSREGYRIMEAFIGTVRDPEIRAELERSIQGNGAFRRFKDAVRSYEETERPWFDFEYERQLEYARGWFESEGLDAELVDDPIPPSRPKPPLTKPTPRAQARPATQPPIGLADMLLFGAPSDPADLINGKALRTYEANDAKRAREMFAALARDICTLCDFPWVDEIGAMDRFNTDRYTLTIDRKSVWLAVDSAPPDLDRFGAT